MNHLLLYSFGEALGDRLTGHKVGPMRLLRPLLVTPVEARGDSQWLVFVLSSPGPFCFIADEDPLAGHGEPVFKRIHGRRIQEVGADRGERLLRLSLADSDESLAFYAFGSSAKVRVEGGGTIIESLKVSETGVALREPAVAPRALSDDAIAAASSGPFHLAGSGRQATPTADSTVAGVTGPYDDPVAACAAEAADMIGAAHGQIIERTAAVIQRRIDKLTRMRDQLQRDLERANDFEAGRNEANILAAFQSRIKTGASSIQLPDLYNPGEEVTIELDPAAVIDEQIQKRFRKATKLERGREVLKKRVQSTAHNVEALTVALGDALGALDFAHNYAALLDVITKHDLVKRSRKAAAVDTQRRYREFDLSPEWFAIVGRSDKENDEITFRVARPDDIWLHAQQIAGSHVVLKSRGTAGNPPEKVLEKAAAIAAHFSKARHSNLVPVIYTLRKYVRKFRGAKPGQVVCEREKTIFAEPGLPSKVGDDNG